MEREKQHHNNKWMPALYVSYYGILKDIAMEHGYALAVHGSITRDFDLIAVPWIKEPKSHLEFLQAIRDVIGLHNASGCPYDSMTEKPHGRVAYTINSAGGGYFDISIIRTV